MNDIGLIKKYVPKDKQEEARKKLLKGEPLQYIIGNTEFLNTIIEVNSSVLIPRFETEYLVSQLIDLIKSKFNSKVKIADLGTGSGAIAIALNKELSSEVTGFDISKDALEVAIANNKINNCKVNFINYDILEKIPGKYDVIVSNPPYIDRNDIIEKKVFDYEPHLALFADHNGLIFYEKILSYAQKVIKDKSIIAFEIGFTQSEIVSNIAKKYFPKSNILQKKDLTGKDRYIFIINE